MKLLFIILFLFPCFSFSQDAIIAVGEAEKDLDKMVIADPEMMTNNGEDQRKALEFVEMVRNNFSFYRHKFNLIAYQDEHKKNFSSPQLEKWREQSISYFLSTKANSTGSKIILHIKVWSVSTGAEIFAEKFKFDENSIRPNALEISDKIYRKITGRPSVFKSKIVFISDRTTQGRDINKELYVMDFDGRRVEKLTNFNSVVLSPSISPDNSKIVFSLIATHTIKTGQKSKFIKNIDLKMLDINTGKFSTISQKPGINSGAIFSGNGENIYLTLSFSGNADIYEMGIKNGVMRKVTSHWADDVDPSMTADGKLMTYLSNRAGRAHIYTVDPTGLEKDVKRISFVGQFNATPRFSPAGTEIVFSSWVDNAFDLYRIGADGNNLVRLTKDFGSNEEPVFSPDGEFIVFTSKKMISRNKSIQDLYIMNRDGEILGKLTDNFGNNFSPVWTNLSN